MLEELKERVCKANIALRENGLAMLTWGNVSAIDREKKLVVIKPSGIAYSELTPDKMVVVNMEGAIVEGNYRPSSDTPTHLALYQGFEELGGIVHTHSRYATIWAQAGLDIIAYGTTHADYFYGDVPCTMPLEENMIEQDYEKNTGYAILDTFARRNLGCMEVQACLVAQHGPFTWGETPEKALENAIVLEEVAHMAVFNTNFQFGLTRISDALLDKHYLRMHGENAYYGQFGDVKALSPEAIAEAAAAEDDIQIAPSNHTVELQNISQIGEVARPIINKPPKKEEAVFNFDDKIAPDSGSDMSDDFDLQPLEPDIKGDDLLPADESELSPISQIPPEDLEPIELVPLPAYDPSKEKPRPIPPYSPDAVHPARHEPLTNTIPEPEPEPEPEPPAEPLDFTF